MLLQGWFVIFNGALYQTMLSWSFRLRFGVWELAKAGMALVRWLAGAFPVAAFLPMAWLKMFEHYYYWPMALRTVFLIGVATVCLATRLYRVVPPRAASAETTLSRTWFASSSVKFPPSFLSWSAIPSECFPGGMPCPSKTSKSRCFSSTSPALASIVCSIFR